MKFETKIFPPVYALVFAFMMWLLHKFVPLAIFIKPPFTKIGFGFIGLSLIIDLWSLALFFRNSTTFHPLKPEDTKHLVTSGPYRFSRNPMYLGMLLLLVGFAFILGSLSPFLVLPLFIILINHVQILPEEKILNKKFGESYREFKSRVRRWL